MRLAVRELAAPGHEGLVAGAADGVEGEGRHPVAVLEGELGAEVALQAAPDGVAGQGAQQLAALHLGRRRDLVVGEVAVAVAQGGHDLADDLPGVRQRLADAPDELGVGHLAALGGGEQVGGDVQ